MPGAADQEGGTESCCTPRMAGGRGWLGPPHQAPCALERGRSTTQ